MKQKTLDDKNARQFLAAATEFVVGYCAIVKWNDRDYANGLTHGWAVRLGRIYSSDGKKCWRRGVATRWHAPECLILDLGDAFKLAKRLTRQDKARRAREYAR